MRVRSFAILSTLFLLVSSIAPLSSSSQGMAPAGPIVLGGLRERVTIRRDERGIPYVEAKNDEDLAFAQGYVTASDRLWQMDLFRRTERGELAEVLTAGPNNIALEQDKQHRTLGFAAVAEAEFANASPQSRVMLEAYARGVNAYISTLDARSEEHTSELQSLAYLVCRLLLEKKNPIGPRQSHPADGRRACADRRPARHAGRCKPPDRLSPPRPHAALRCSGSGHTQARSGPQL